MLIDGIWLLVGFVRSLLSSHKRGFFSASLCEDFSDLTSPTSNHNYTSSYFCCTCL